jgi:hypothetical protein
MAEPNGESRVVDYYTDVVLPALAERLDTAFPEFGWRRDARGWIATNEEMTRRELGARAERVIAHGPAPRGFLVHGGDAVLWTAYVNGGHIPRGRDFVATVRSLAERAGVDVSPLDRPEQRDRRAELLDDFFELARAELASERGEAARQYLEARGFPREVVETSGLGVVPPAAELRRALADKGYTKQGVEESGLLADRRWAGRICGAWRDERGGVRTVWARTLDGGGDPGAKYLYLRGASRTGLPPYGLSEVLAQPLAERRELVLVEGLLDPHHFRAHGIRNVAALGGTSTPPETFERLARRGFEEVTICLDRDLPGRTATARVVDRAVRASTNPAIFVLESEHLAPSKDPDQFLRERGPDAWRELLEKRECGVTWRARDLLGGVEPEASKLARRNALHRAGMWLGSLPPSLALEQDDAVREVATRCGYDGEAVTRAFRARFWNENAPRFRNTRRRDPIDVGRGL